MMTLSSNLPMDQISSVSLADPETGAPAGTAARRTALTRHRVIAVALQIIDGEGVESLSMRRLGCALDRNAMAVYLYAADKDALLDAVLDFVLADCVAPANELLDGERDWAHSLREAADALRRAAVAHPNLIQLLVTRSLTGPLRRRSPAALRLLEQLLGLFAGAGLQQQEAVLAAREFLGFVGGQLLTEVGSLAGPAVGAAGRGRRRLSAPGRQSELYESLNAVFGDFDAVAAFEHGMAVLITGLQQRQREVARPYRVSNGPPCNPISSPMFVLSPTSALLSPTASRELS